MKVVNAAMNPPGGWSIVDHNVTIESDSKRSLLHKLAVFREQNGYDTANVAADLDNYFCAKAPHFCFDFSIPGNTSIAQENKEIALAHRILAWASSLVGNTSLELVDKKTAQERASFCASCPFNNQYPKGCGSCKGNLTQSLSKIRKKQSISGVELLHGCDQMGWDNHTAAWLHEKHLQGKNPAAGVNCWKAPRP